MRRRDLLALAAGSALWPLAARAQPSTKLRRIAIFHPDIPAGLITADSFWRALIDDLRQRGYSEGKNLVVETYSADGHHERWADLAREIATRQPDVIVTVRNPVVAAFMRATSAIPVVAIMFDPLKAGLVTSLARPGGNLTGVNLTVGVEMWGKLLQTLKDAIPSASTVAVFGFIEGGWDGPMGQVLRDTSGRLGISLTGMVLREETPSEIEPIFAAMAQQRPDAVLVSGQYGQRELIIDLAAKHRLPAIYPLAGYVEQGGLMAYFADPAEARHRLADNVREILNGAKPGDIPIYQTTKFRLSINMKAAKALGLNLPEAFLARADEVIE